MLDKLRKDSVALLSLHNVISKKEKELAALRQQLKVTSDEVVLPLSALTTKEQEVLAPEAAAASSGATPATATGAAAAIAAASATPAAAAPATAAQQVVQAQAAQKRKVAGAAEVAQKGKRLKK